MLECFWLASPTPKHQPPWVEKDWTRWTTYDDDEVLNRSPWGRSYFHDNGDYSTLSIRQLRSALPIRQALLRELQLQNHYDKMNPQERQAFDLQHSDDVKETGDDSILFYTGEEVHPYIPPSGELYPAILPAVESHAIALRLPDGTLIMPSRMTILHYDTYKKDYLFAFPRKTDGKPVVGPGDQNLTIVEGQEHLAHPNLGLLGPVDLGPMKKEDFHQVPDTKYVHPTNYSIASLMYKGKPEY